MKRIFSKGTLRNYWELFPETEQYLKTWFEHTLSSEWNNPHDVKLSYIHASILKNNRIVFNIKANDHRLVVKFNFKKRWAFIRFIGTHEEYNKIDAETI